ncbi:MAG: hypothetical protein WDO56_03870 [Gammaproteobacteria bacterium]
MKEDTPTTTPSTGAILGTVAPGARLQPANGVSQPIDGRSRLGRTFRRTRGAIVQSLGGVENLSEQQALAIRMLAEAEALRAGEFAKASRSQEYSVTAWAAFAKVSANALKVLGMKRVPKDVQDLHSYMKSGGA